MLDSCVKVLDFTPEVWFGHRGQIPVQPDSHHSQAKAQQIELALDGGHCAFYCKNEGTDQIDGE